MPAGFVLHQITLHPVTRQNKVQRHLHMKRTAASRGISSSSVHISPFSDQHRSGPSTGNTWCLSWYPSLVPAFLHAWLPHRFHPWCAPGRLSKMCSRLIEEQGVKENIWKQEVQTLHGKEWCESGQVLEDSFSSYHVFTSASVCDKDLHT